MGSIVVQEILLLSYKHDVLTASICTNVCGSTDVVARQRGVPGGSLAAEEEG
jgi:hypothetical protein